MDAALPPAVDAFSSQTHAGIEKGPQRNPTPPQGSQVELLHDARDFLRALPLQPTPSRWADKRHMPRQAARNDLLLYVDFSSVRPRRPAQTCTQHRLRIPPVSFVVGDPAGPYGQGRSRKKSRSAIIVVVRLSGIAWAFHGGAARRAAGVIMKLGLATVGLSGAASAAEGVILEPRSGIAPSARQVSCSSTRPPRQGPQVRPCTLRVSLGPSRGRAYRACYHNGSDPTA